MDEIKLDIRDIAIIDAFPIHDCRKLMLDVGCGKSRVGRAMKKNGWEVQSTDIEEHKSWNLYNYEEAMMFYKANIFDLSSFRFKSYPVVICLEVLEHLKDFRKAFNNLLKLTEIRLIFTVPYKQSFNSPGHCNYWDDFSHPSNDKNVFKDINAFVDFAKPYSVSISKIRTKEQDVKYKQWAYLIIVDKRQCFNT